jgi:DinB superfamily
MRKRKRAGNILLTLLVITGFAGTPFDASLSKKERKFIVHHLKETKADFLTSVKDLSEAQLNFKAAPDKWSVKECAQHLALAEAGLWQWAEMTLKQPANPEKRAEIKMTDEAMLKGVTNRAQKAQAPENFQPKNAKWATIDETLTAYKEQRAKLIDYLKSTTEDMRGHIAVETPFGPIDAYQIVLLISAHSNRHTQQINEVKANPDFPKN